MRVVPWPPRLRIALLFFCCSWRLPAQTGNEPEPLAILEIGGAPNKSLSGGGFSMSPTAAVEFTPIDKWLEMEAGTTPSFTHHTTEWDTDLLFKKPW